MIDVLQSAIDSDIPTILWGSPGSGKTAAIQALATSASAMLVTLIGSTLDSTEVGGVLYPTDGQLRRSNPDWADAISRAVAGKKTAWLFLDELSCSPSPVQAALLRVVHERRVGALDLSTVRIVAAANPADSAASGGWLSPAMASRWLHVDWRVDPTAWCAGEVGGWGRNMAPHESAASALVSSWIARSPSSLSPDWPANVDVRGWPCPRAWSHVARFLAGTRAGSVSEKSRAGIAGVDGLVGHAAGEEFRTWAAALDLPDPESILSGASLPKRGDQVAACLSAVAAAALSDHPRRADRIQQAWRVMARARPDLTVIPARALSASGEDVPDEASALADRLRTAKGSLN